ncbi:MAG: hypothetical protein WA081_00335 [Desulfosalsimonadaceae bacterium]
MIAFDTNALVRVLVEDDKDQAKIVRDIRETAITNLPFLDRLLCPTSVERVTVAIVAQGLIFRCRKF